MSLILDLIIIAIMLLNIYICYKKGLVKLAVGLIAVIASIILALVFYKPVSNLIVKNTEIDDKIKTSIIENFTTNEITTNEENEDNLMMEYIQHYVDDTVNKTKNEIVTEAAGIISAKVIDIGSMIGIFIIARLILIVLTFISDIITDLPLIKQFNDIGGILYGIVKALLIIYVILAIAFFIIYVSGNTTLETAIANSYITKFFYNNNILIEIIF